MRHIAAAANLPLFTKVYGLRHFATPEKTATKEGAGDKRQEWEKKKACSDAGLQ